MNRFQKSTKQNRISALSVFSAILFVIIIVGFLLGIATLQGTKEKGGKEFLETAIEHDITHCYAVEGKYPPSIQYLEDNYGLTYNKENYLIDYTIVGANIRPTVMILEKNR